jgi:ActR/RegA family two-component response regulator
MPRARVFARVSAEVGAIMSASLTGCLVLVVEDEALIGMDIAAAFREAGAQVLLARTLKQALAHAQNDPLTGAVIDHSLHDGVTTSDVCAALEKRHILHRLQWLRSDTRSVRQR